MHIDPSNARAVVRLNGEDVAYAGGGGKTEDKKITLRNLTIAEESHRGEQLASGTWGYALENVFEIEIRNSDGKPTRFRSCRADFGGLLLSKMPATEQLASVEFWILDSPDR